MAFIIAKTFFGCWRPWDEEAGELWDCTGVAAVADADEDVDAEDLHSVA